jgi:hypothetical protein
MITIKLLIIILIFLLSSDTQVTSFIIYNSESKNVINKNTQNDHEFEVSTISKINHFDLRFPNSNEKNEVEFNTKKLKNIAKDKDENSDSKNYDYSEETKNLNVFIIENNFYDNENLTSPKHSEEIKRMLQDKNNPTNPEITENPTISTDWRYLKFLQLKDNKIFYPSIKKVKNNLIPEEFNYVLAYQKRDPVSYFFQIYLIIFNKEMTILIDEVKLTSQNELNDNIEPKIISFEAPSNPTLPYEYVIIWKSKENCPSMKFKAATFKYGETKPISTKDLIKCGPNLGEIQSMMNYDVAATLTHKIFLSWHEKNDNRYSIYITVINSDTLEFVFEKKEISKEGNLMYPNLRSLESEKMLLVYQHDKGSIFNIYYTIFNDSLINIVIADQISESTDKKVSFPKIHKVSAYKFLITYLMDSNRQDKVAKYNVKGVYLDFINDYLISTKIIRNFKSNIYEYSNRNLAVSCGDRKDEACPIMYSSANLNNDPKWANDNDYKDCMNKWFISSSNLLDEWFRIFITDKDTKIPIKRIKIHTTSNFQYLKYLNGFYASIGQMNEDYKSLKSPYNRKNCYRENLNIFSENNNFIEFYCEGEGNMIEIGRNKIGDNLNEVLLCEVQIFQIDEQFIPKFTYLNSKNQLIISYLKNQDNNLFYNLFDELNNIELLINDLPLNEIRDSILLKKLPLILNNDEFELLEHYFNPEQMNFSCDKSCLKGCYNGAFKCNECESEYIKSNDGKCLNENTSEGYQIIDEIYSGSGCGLNCEKCTSYCTNCKPNTYLIQGKKSCEFQSETVDFYHFDINNNIFEKCGDNCKKCSSSTICDECTDLYKINPNSYECVKTLEGYYPDGITFKKCGINCKNCKNAISCELCTNIIFKKVPEKNICLEKLEGHYIVEDAFIKCGINCKNCKDSYTCESCIDPIKYKIVPRKNQCLESLDRHYPTQIDFKECGKNCKNCKDAVTCEICDENYYKLDYISLNENRNCYSIIEVKIIQYFDKNDKKIKQCDIACNGCSINSKNCTNCKENFYKISNIEGVENNFCYMSKENHYLDSENKILKLCDISCKECKNFSNYCLICEENYFNKFEDINSGCFDKTITKLGYFFDNNVSKWNLCDQSCLNCESKFNCIDCNEKQGFQTFDLLEYELPKDFSKADLPIQNLSTFKKLCFKNGFTIKGFYYDKEEKKFKKCDKKCSECDNNKTCLKCNSDLSYYPKFDKITGNNMFFNKRMF